MAINGRARRLRSLHWCSLWHRGTARRPCGRGWYVVRPWCVDRQLPRLASGNRRQAFAAVRCAGPNGVDFDVAPCVGRRRGTTAGRAPEIATRATRTITETRVTCGGVGAFSGIYAGGSPSLSSTRTSCGCASSYSWRTPCASASSPCESTPSAFASVPAWVLRCHSRAATPVRCRRCPRVGFGHHRAGAGVFRSRDQSIPRNEEESNLRPEDGRAACAPAAAFPASAFQAPPRAPLGLPRRDSSRRMPPSRLCRNAEVLAADGEDPVERLQRGAIEFEQIVGKAMITGGDGPRADRR